MKKRNYLIAFAALPIISLPVLAISCGSSHNQVDSRETVTPFDNNRTINEQIKDKIFFLNTNPNTITTEAAVNKLSNSELSVKIKYLTTILDKSVLPIFTGLNYQSIGAEVAKDNGIIEDDSQTIKVSITFNVAAGNASTTQSENISFKITGFQSMSKKTDDLEYQKKLIQMATTPSTNN